MWCGAGISLTGLGCWPQGRGMLPGLHIVIIASNEPAHEAQCLWVFPLSLCYNIHDSSHYGAFWAPWGTGRGNLSMLLPASVKAQSMQENPWVCMYSVWERTYLCSTVCDWSLAGTDFSVFFSLIWERKLLEADLLCRNLHIQALNEKLRQGHIFSCFSLSFFLFNSFFFLII